MDYGRFPKILVENGKKGGEYNNYNNYYSNII